MRRGKVVFAERCARCHSSKLPPLPAGLDLENCNGKDYLACWDRYWALDQDRRDSRRRCGESSLADDFLTDNYLSTELRVPSTLMQTNICSPIATNAIAGNIWDNFSSQSYKELPSVGTVKLRNPLSGAEFDFTLPGGGRGYTRPASLVSLWSTAPFLQNNSVGPFESRTRRSRPACDVFDEVDRADAVARSAATRSELFTRLNITGPGVGCDPAHDPKTATSACRRVSSPTASRRCSASASGCSRCSSATARSRSDRFPKGTPVSLFTSMDLTGADLPEAERKAQRKKLLAARSNRSSAS